MTYHVLEHLKKYNHWSYRFWKYIKFGRYYNCKAQIYADDVPWEKFDGEGDYPIYTFDKFLKELNDNETKTSI